MTEGEGVQESDTPPNASCDVFCIFVAKQNTRAWSMDSVEIFLNTTQTE